MMTPKDRVYIAAKNNTDPTEIICISDKIEHVKKYIVANEISDYRIFFSDDKDFINILYIDYLDAVFLVETYIEGYGYFICTMDEYSELHQTNFEYIRMIKDTMNNIRDILLNSNMSEKEKKKLVKAGQILYKLSNSTIDINLVNNKNLRKAVELHNEMHNRRYTINNKHYLLLLV